MGKPIVREFGQNKTILKFFPYQGAACVVETSADYVTATEDGRKIVKAGTPVNKSGVADNTATAIGILRFDVTEDRPQGILLKKAYLNTAVAEKHSGVTYDAAVKTALPMIVFE